MIRLVVTVVCTSFVTATLVALMIENNGIKKINKIEEKMELAVKKIEILESNSRFVAKQWEVENVMKHVSPSDCRIENMKIDLQTASLNGIPIFKADNKLIAKSIPCLTIVERDKILKSEDNFFSFGLSDYDSRTVMYAYSRENEEKGFVVKESRDTDSSTFVNNIGYRWWRQPKKIDEIFKDRQFDGVGKIKGIETLKVAYKTNYGCAIVLNSLIKSEKAESFEVRMSNKKCSNYDVKFSVLEEIN